MYDEEEDLNDVKISDVLSEDFMNSNFWIYWKTMFALNLGILQWKCVVI